jgi:hypothetical protein
MKAAAAVLAALVFGVIGVFLYGYYVSFNHAEGPLREITAYALSWPVVLVGKMTESPARINAVAGIILQVFGWLALVLYYYLIVSLAVSIRTVRPRRLRN